MIIKNKSISRKELKDFQDKCKDAYKLYCKTLAAEIEEAERR
jgi:hypothetical protein